jgi:HD-like signal output (HDOD) protein
MITHAEARLSKGAVLALVKKKLRERQLPVLRKTVSRIVDLASTMKSNIGQLAQTILQDQSFTAKVLAVANSPHYKHNPEPITTITRAIIQIGYTTLRDIAVAAEFTEMVQKRLPHGINLHSLLAKAFVAAHQAKRVSEALQASHAEQIFTHTLLRNIGDFALAYYMPTEYHEIERLRQSEGLAADVAYHQILGITPQEFRVAIIEAYDLPAELATPAPNWAAAASWTELERMQAIASVANEITAILFAQGPDANTRLNELLHKAATAFHVDVALLESLIVEGFQKACTLGHSLEMDPASFLPTVPDCTPGDHVLHPLIDACIKVVEPLMAASLDQPLVLPSDSIGSAGLLVSILTDLTHHVMTAPDLNTVLTCVLEGLHRAVGFDHAIVLLTVPGKNSAEGRSGVGTDIPALLPLFNISTDPNANALAHAMANKIPIRLTAGEPVSPPLPPAIMDAIQPTGIALAPLHASNRVIGLIWADRKDSDIDDAMWKSFQLFALQGNLALMRLTSKS